jgi:DUF4097 and DUF4098 domain-containing protein YvlB
MRTLKALALAVLMAGMATAAQAANEQQRTIEASADGKVTISNVAGSIEVMGWSRNEVQVDADLGWDVEELIVERDGDEVLVKVKTPRDSRGNISSELVVRVPENSSLDVAGVSSDIEVRDVYGEQTLHAVSGDVVTQAFAADISVEAVSGDVEVSGDRKPIYFAASTVSGDLDVAGVHGNIEATTVSGDLTIAEGRFERANANSVNGDIVLRAELMDGGRLDMETINGSIDLHFDGEVAARFDIETFNGNIRNCFGPEAQRTSRYTPGRSLKFTEGSGDARVTIRTLNGNLRMCRDE